MKRILYITHNNELLSDGVWKKITYQVSAFRKMGFTVDFFYMKPGVFILDRNGEIQTFPLNGKNKYLFYKLVADLIRAQKVNYDFSYIRKPHGGFFSIFLVNLLNVLKKGNSKIVIEVPTYPYKNELNSIKEKVSDFVFEFTIPFIKKYIDCVVYLGMPTDYIWNIKAFSISNGIDINEIQLVPEKNCIANADFVLSGIANLAFWHGYDRVIFGMKEYRGERNLIFKIVGGTEPELSRLKDIVKKEKLEKNVVFCGRLSGDKLENIFYDVDVCIDAIGRHRSGNSHNSSIKSKEYAARGIPFIKSHVDDAFDNEEFIYNAASDDSPLNIENIIAWRERLPPNFSKNEREFAVKNLTWETQFNRLIDYLKDN